MEDRSDQESDLEQELPQVSHCLYCLYDPVNLRNSLDLQFISCTSDPIESVPRHLLDLINKCNRLVQEGDFAATIKLYTEAIYGDPNYSILYVKRSAAFADVGKFSQSLQDAIRARELNPRWSQSYFRQGIALQGLGRHADALAAFASGLAQDNKNTDLLIAFIEAALKSPFRGSLEPIYRRLQTMQLDRSPYVITSVVGQELLKRKILEPAVVVLESSLRIGTSSMKLRGSVYSALGSAYWQLGDLEKALHFMMSDLQVAKSLGDQIGECRSHGNIGTAHFSSKNFQESLSCHRQQLVLALKGRYTDQAANALTSLGHVYTEMGDLTNALASHKQCLTLVKQTGDTAKECIETGNVASVLLSLGDHDKALEILETHLQLAIASGFKMEEAKNYSNLAILYHSRGVLDKAIESYEKLLKVSQELNDKIIEGKAYEGLGRVSQSRADISSAKKWFAKQLETSLKTKDKKSEGKACSNLGSLYQLMSDFDGALKLHWTHLQIAKELGDASGMGQAYANIGACYSSLNKYDEAFKYNSYLLNSMKKSKSICSN
jgi:tetratricopeptide (TPR) repeat protein